MKKIILLLVLLFSFSLFASDFDQTKKLSLDANDISRLFIDCGAGFLKLSGENDLDEIRVTAKIEIDNIDSEDVERIIDKYMQLTLKKRGHRAELISNFERKNSFFSSIFNNYENVRIDLTVEIPKKLNVEIDDGSGFIEVKEIDGDIFIDDGSDYIEMHDIKGKVEIDDGSGDIDIDNVIGNVEIDDGSGDIDLRNITGDIYLDDGSGSITVVEIDGNVRVDDGSGSINIEGVEEDVIIEDDGSGSVNIKDIAGNIYRYDE
jgi:DUF4097 and DUF4098 domain-containing protein YvlB